MHGDPRWDRGANTDELSLRIAEPVPIKARDPFLRIEVYQSPIHMIKLINLGLSSIFVYNKI